MTRRLGIGLAVGVLLAAAVGAGVLVTSRTSYCEALRANQAHFAPMLEGDLGALGDLGFLEELADKAPEDLQDEWQTFLGALHAFVDTLADVGLDVDELSADDVDDALSDLPEADRDRVVRATTQLREPGVVTASSNIDQQAKDVCKVQLGLG